MKYFTISLLLILTQLNLIAGFEGYEWGDYTQSVIKTESNRGNHVSDCYLKRDPSSLAVGFGYREIHGIEVMTVMHFSKSNKLFYGYHTAMKDVSDQKLKEIISSLNSKYKRTPKPYTASSLNHKMWWESTDSYIFLIWIPSSSFLSINYVTKDYSFDRGEFISESFGSYN